MLSVDFNSRYLPMLDNYGNNKLKLPIALCARPIKLHVSADVPLLIFIIQCNKPMKSKNHMTISFSYNLLLYKNRIAFWDLSNLASIHNRGYSYCSVTGVSQGIAIVSLSNAHGCFIKVEGLSLYF